jgi:hypothetical protein
MEYQMKSKFIKAIAASLLLISSYSHGAVILLDGSATASSTGSSTISQTLAMPPAQHATSTASDGWMFGSGTNNSDAEFSFFEDAFGVVTIAGSVTSNSGGTAVTVSGWANLLANLELTSEYNYDYSASGTSYGRGDGTSTMSFGASFLQAGSSTALAPSSSGLLSIGLYDLTADAESYSSIGFLRGSNNANASAAFSLILTPTGSVVSVASTALVVSVPEPSTLAIFALGLMGLASRRLKKQSV